MDDKKATTKNRSTAFFAPLRFGGLPGVLEGTADVTYTKADDLVMFVKALYSFWGDMPVELVERLLSDDQMKFWRTVATRAPWCHLFRAAEQGHHEELREEMVRLFFH